MKHREACDEYCGLARSAAVIGENWNILILRQIMFLGNSRFDQIQDELGLSRHLLATRLKALIDSGVLEKYRLNEDAKRLAYRLTDQGRELFPALLALLEWGEKYQLEGKAPVKHIHTECEHVTASKTVCSHCNEQLTSDSFTMERVKTAR